MWKDSRNHLYQKLHKTNLAFDRRYYDPNLSSVFKAGQQIAKCCRHVVVADFYGSRETFPGLEVGQP